MLDIVTKRVCDQENSRLGVCLVGNGCGFMDIGLRTDEKRPDWCSREIRAVIFETGVTLPAN